MKKFLKLFLVLITFVALLSIEGDSIVSSPANSSDSSHQESKVLTDTNKVDSVLIVDTVSIVEDWEVVMETGATWYGHPYHGRRTASGVIYNMYDYSFARQVKLANKFKFGKEYKVTNIKNGKSVIVVCNDTGPLQKGISIDLSYQAMKDLDGIQAGKIKVKIEQLKKK